MSDVWWNTADYREERREEMEREDREARLDAARGIQKKAIEEKKFHVWIGPRVIELLREQGCRIFCDVHGNITEIRLP